MRTIKLPDLARYIEDDVYLEKAIRAELDKDPYCNFEFDEATTEYHIYRFSSIVNKVNWWLMAHNRPGKVTVSVIRQTPPVILEVIPEPELPMLVEVLPELAPIIEEQQPTKKKKNG